MRKLFVTALVAMLATAGLAACGGGDDDDNASSATEADREETSDASDDDDDGGDIDEALEGSDELKELLAKQSKARVKVTYEMRDQDGETTTMVFAQDGKGKRSIFSDGTLTIIDGDTAVSCDNLDSPDVSCTQLPSGFGEFAMLGLGLFTAIGEGLVKADVAGVDISSEKIAGRDARCAEYDYDNIFGALGELAELGDDDVPEDAKVRVCVDKETGILLEFTGEGDGEFGTIIATEVTEPSDADFEVPVTPETMPDFGDFDLDDLEDMLENNN